ncbi:hypothetical protein [Massilia sp. WF1]|uniref:hypothetical protein n=1 Tax=Massilia sp. WF1 TaxID=1406431 RepID=UPI0012E2B00C|nr:hypothetical protein [Massilia sp. WF1]
MNSKQAKKGQRKLALFVFGRPAQALFAPMNPKQAKKGQRKLALFVFGRPAQALFAPSNASHFRKRRSRCLFAARDLLQAIRIYCIYGLFAFSVIDAVYLTRHRSGPILNFTELVRCLASRHALFAGASRLPSLLFIVLNKSGQAIRTMCD